MHTTNPEINIGIQHFHKPTNPRINIHHKPTNPYQQNSQPTNPPSEYISPPPSTPLSWEIERWKSHLGLSLSGDEIMRLESLGSSRLHYHWSGLQYRIGDWGFVQRSHTKLATMVSYRIGGPSRGFSFFDGSGDLTESWTSSTAGTSSLRFERVWVRLEFGSWWRWDFERVWVWERFRQGWREKGKIRDRESLEMRLKEKEKELRLKKIWFEMRFGSLCLFFN